MVDIISDFDMARQRFERLLNIPPPLGANGCIGLFIGAVGVGI